MKPNSPEPVPTAPKEQAHQTPANPSPEQKPRKTFVFVRNVPCRPLELPGRKDPVLFEQPRDGRSKRFLPHARFETSDEALAEAIRACARKNLQLGIEELPS